MNIQFEENNNKGRYYKSRTIIGAYQTPKIIEQMIKFKIAKNEKTATLILIIFISSCIILTLFIFIQNNKPKKINYNLSDEVLNALPKEIQTKIYESQKK